MASYSILFKPSVEKDLRPLPKSVVARVMKQIEILRENPIPRQSVKLAGAEQLYRIRVGDYRVIYGVEKEAKQVKVAQLFEEVGALHVENTQVNRTSY